MVVKVKVLALGIQQLARRVIVQLLRLVVLVVAAVLPTQSPLIQLELLIL